MTHPKTPLLAHDNEGASRGTNASSPPTGNGEPGDYLRAMVIPIYNQAGHVVSSTIVDPDLFPSVGSWRWSINHAGYVMRSIALPGGHKRTLRLHRLVMCCTHGDGLEVDHVNRNTLDNRRSNLRIVTHLENMQNREAKPKAVVRQRVRRLPKPRVKPEPKARAQARPTRDFHGNGWVARFTHNKVTYRVGRFTTYEEADAALAEARAKVIGS